MTTIPVIAFHLPEKILPFPVIAIFAHEWGLVQYSLKLIFMTAVPDCGILRNLSKLSLSKHQHHPVKCQMLSLTIACLVSMQCHACFRMHQTLLLPAFSRIHTSFPWGAISQLDRSLCHKCSIINSVQYIFIACVTVTWKHAPIQKSWALLYLLPVYICELHTNIHSLYGHIAYKNNHMGMLWNSQTQLWREVMDQLGWSHIHTRSLIPLYT